jgi:hypothetical protein
LSVPFPIKTKVRSKLEAGHDVRVALLKMWCRTEIFVASKQWECSQEWFTSFGIFWHLALRFLDRWSLFKLNLIILITYD